MMGSNPLPSTAVAAARGGSSGALDHRRRREEDEGKRPIGPPPPPVRAGSHNPPAPNADRPHSEDEYKKTLAAIRKEVRLDEIPQEEFRAVLDPDSGPEAFESTWKWDSDKQDEFVALLQPAHLSLLINKRLQAHLQRRAKTLTFEHLTIVQRGVEVLSDASGDLRGGEMIGLIGGPDSGVSPLLSALSQQMDRSKLKAGEVLYDGRPPGRGYQQAVGFAVKNDTHIAALTVYESLYFSARTRLPNRVPNGAVQLRVKMIMKLLGLSHVADTPVGDAMTRGISGGEKRRLGFGLELVAGHSVVLADLPTNGLDSATAFGLLQTMSYAAKMGIAVMLSLVQASLELLTVFDRLMVLCKGRIIYVGRLDKVEDYLKDAGFVRPKKKALPQFLEELSSKPEHFYHSKPRKEPSTSPQNADGKGSPRKPSPGKGRSPASRHDQQQRQQQDGDGRDDRSKQQGADDEVGSPAPQPQPADIEEGRAESSGRDGGPSPREDKQPESGRGKEAQGGGGSGKGGDGDGDESSPSRDAFNVLVVTWQNSDLAKDDRRRRQKEDAKEGGEDGGGKGEGGASKTEQEPAGAAPGRHHTPSADARSTPSSRRGQSSPPSSAADPSAATAAASFALAPSMNPSTQQPIQWLEVITPQHTSTALSTARPSSPEKTRSATTAMDGAVDKHPQQQRQQQQRGQSDDGSDGDDAKVSWVWRRWFQYYNSGPLIQFEQNVHRHALLTFRNTGLWRDIWILAALIGVIIGSLFYQLGDDEIGVRNRLGLYFYLISYLGFNAVQLVPVLASQRTVLSNETRSGYYHHAAYFFSLLLVQLPIVLVEALLVLTPVWGLSQLRGMDWEGRFWFAYLVVSLTSYTSRAFMFVVYGLSPNEAYADVLNQVSNILFTKLCGYFIPQREIVVGWHWVYYLSYFTFAFRALALNDILPISRDCTPSPEQECLFTTGPGALELLYTMDASWSKWLQVEYLFDFFLAFCAIGFVAMWQVDWAVTEDWDEPYFMTAQEIKEDEQSHQQGDEDNEEKGDGDNGSKEQQKQPQPEQQEDQQPHQQPQQRNGKYDAEAERGGTGAGVQKDPKKSVEEKREHGVTMEFHQLNYSVDVKGGKQRRLLHDVYGYCTPGMMVALMGATGAGKSTLLDLLANKKTGGHTSGSILINGEERGSDFQHLAGYVEQFDSLYPWSTIREALHFSGRLRLPPEVTDEELTKKVDKTLRTLGLTHMQHSVIGGAEMGGVSQEARKKVTIGVELMLEPQLLFLDEPTTGRPLIVRVTVGGALCPVSVTLCLTRTPSSSCSC